MVVNGFKHRGAYDLNTGEEIWRMSGGGDIPVPTPIVWKDLIFFNSAHGYRAPLMALRNSATGRIKYPGRTQDPPPEILWLDDRAGAYMTSVVIYDSLLYQLRWNGNLTCMNPRTGKLHYRETIRPTSFIASPVIADQRIYLLSEEGDLYIVACGNTYKLLKKLPLGETSLVTPAISEGMLIFRTSHALIAVSE